MERGMTVTGTLAAHEASLLSSKVPGRLQQVMVDVGSVVRQGEELAQVEPRDYELRLQQAQAAVAQVRAELGLNPEGGDDRVEVGGVTAVRQAQAVLDESRKNRERVRELLGSGIATQAEFDTAEAAYVVARTKLESAREEARVRVASLAQRRAELEIARKQLSDTVVRAPYDGVVQTRVASVGQYVASGTPVVSLVRADPLRLRLDVPERLVSLIQAGQSLRLTVDGDVAVYRGTVARLSPALDDVTRTLRVEADVPLQGRLRPGLFARATIVVNAAEPGLAVPLNALVSFAGLEKVLTVKDGKAVERVITTGRRGSNWVEVVAGLQAGERVVLDPGGLRTGQPVLVKEGGQRTAPPGGAQSALSPGRTRDLAG